MRILASILMAMATLGAVRSAAAQGHEGGPPILGYHVVLKANDGDDAKGELIAVSPDSLWLLRKDALAIFPLADMKQVKIRESSFGGGDAAIWSLVVGTISGLGLMAACSSVQDTDCGLILPVVLLSWTFIGGIAVLAVEPQRYAEFPAPSAEQLRPYSRFPQGLPEGFRPGDSATDTTSAGRSGGGNKRR
jgi:hypothetical protein